MTAIENSPSAGPAAMGHNNPPSPFAEACAEVDRVWTEATHWLDGGMVIDQAEADAVGQLVDMARKARKTADHARRDEAKPFDDGKAEVQERYKPLLAKCDNITEAGKAAMKPFLAAQEKAKREKEAKAAAEAEAARKAAQGAFASARGIEDREHAEGLAEAAKSAEIAARVAAKDTAKAKGGARAISLRTTIEPEVFDLHALMTWIWLHDRSALAGFAEQYAAGAFRAGHRDMDGVRAVERQAVA